MAGEDVLNGCIEGRRIRDADRLRRRVAGDLGKVCSVAGQEADIASAGADERINSGRCESGRSGRGRRRSRQGARWNSEQYIARLIEAGIVTADRNPERSKPRPTLYLEALDRLGVAADEAIAFEDSPNGVKAAKAAGIFTVAVPNGVTVTLGLGEADLLLESLAELSLRELLERVA